MAAKISQYGAFPICILAGMVSWAGCTTAQVSPLPELPLEPPGYVQVPHPEGLDFGDLLAIFTDRSAPSPGELKTCDEDFLRLRKQTQSQEELLQGAREFIRTEPVKYHWCFYGKLLQMEEAIKQDIYIDEKQKHILDTYVFLTPFARAFLAEYHDSRYLRWATTRYRRLSEYVFFRKLELSSESAEELSVSSNPFGLLRPADQTRRGVLEKYGVVNTDDIPAVPTAPPMALLPDTSPVSQAAVTPSSAPVAEPVRAPASERAEETYPAAAEEAPSEAVIQDGSLTPVQK